MDYGYPYKLVEIINGRESPNAAIPEAVHAISIGSYLKLLEKIKAERGVLLDSQPDDIVLNMLPIKKTDEWLLSVIKLDCVPVTLSPGGDEERQLLKQIADDMMLVYTAGYKDFSRIAVIFANITLKLGKGEIQSISQMRQVYEGLLTKSAIKITPADLEKIHNTFTT